MKVTIYQFTVCSGSQAGAERAEVAGVGGNARGNPSHGKDFAGRLRIFEDTAKEIDASAVDSMGFTKLDFDPGRGRWPRRDKTR